MKVFSLPLLQYVLAAGLFLAGCQKTVAVDPPKTQLVAETVFKTDGTAVAAQLAIYAQMEAEGLPFYLPVAAGLSADELENFSPGTDYAELYANGLSSTNGAAYSLWSSFYKYIYEANAVLEGIKPASALSGIVRQQLEGEAKFVRAFCHFYLVNLYGDVPVLTSTDYRTNALEARRPAAEVYQSILKDLSDAKALLSAEYRSGTAGTTTERTRPNKWAAAALLAKAYLYSSNWSAAEAEATAVLNESSTYTLEPNVDSVFLKDSKEAIWQLLPVLPGYNSIEGGSFILTTTPSLVALSASLVANFDSADKRRVAWIQSINVDNAEYDYAFKYKAYQNQPAITEYSIVLRLAEIYLLRAEARARQANLSGAMEDLGVVRNRAGLALAPLMDQTALVAAISEERKKELFTEMGQRWLDLKHTGQTPVLAAKGNGWRESAGLYPIPQAELNTNPHLTQNPGY